MAEVGFYLHGARGKLAGAYFSRGANGKTIAHEIVEPTNPRTNAQQYQRAIMATVMRAYSAGKAIFSHSFSGVSNGSGDQQRFVAENVKLLRNAIADDLRTHVAPRFQKGRVVAPNTKAPVPFDYLISDGSLTQDVFSIAAQNSNWDVSIPRPLRYETVSAYCSRVGLVPNDFYTICIFGQSDTDFAYEDLGGDEGVSQYRCFFNYARLGVKPNVLTNNNPVEVWADVFSLLTDGQMIELDARQLNYDACEGIDISNISSSYYSYGSIGVIRSQKNSDKRSRSFMKYLNGGHPTGIYSTRILDVWGNGSPFFPVDQELFTDWNSFVQAITVFKNLEHQQSGMNYMGFVDSYGNKYILRCVTGAATYFPLGGFTEGTDNGSFSAKPLSVADANDNEAICAEVNEGYIETMFTDVELTPPSVDNPKYLDIYLVSSCYWDSEEQTGTPQVVIKTPWEKQMGDVVGYDDNWPVSSLTDIGCQATEY